MSSLRQGVASAVDADVRLALQKMSAVFVRGALDDATDPASAAAAAHDAMSLQDALYGVPASGTESSRAPKSRASAPATAPASAPAPAPIAARVAPEQRPQKPSPKSGKTPSRSSKRSSSAHQPSPKALPDSAPPVQIRRTRAVAVAPALRRAPSSISSPAPATARKKPQPRMQNEELLPDTEGLPLMLRRRPSLVLKEARGKSAPARAQMITTARAALSELHKGAHPTKVARPAGDRAHAIIKGIERMQLTSPVNKATTSSKKKVKRKLKGGLAMNGASLQPAVRAQLEKAEREAAASAKSRSIDTVARLPLSSRQAMYRGYGFPVSGGLPSLGRRS